MKTHLSFFFILFCILHFDSFAQSTWITDTKSGCKVYNPEPQPDESISWEGSCKQGLINGFGTLIWYNNGNEVARHVGLFENGKPNGKGRFTIKNGDSTEGNFVMGSIVNLDENMLKDLHVHELDITDSTDIYAADGISKSLFYYAIKPTGAIKGTLLLFSGTMETPADVVNNNVSFLKLAHENNLMVIIPSINNNLFISRAALSFINYAIADAIKNYKLESQKFILGGFSLGGMTALRYTELSVEDKSKTIVHPVAVYAIDSPLDFLRLYSSFSRISDNHFSEGAANEANYYLQKMNAQFGGTPSVNEKIYATNSIFSRNEKNGGNTAFLKNTPVRVYCDPDIDWWLKNRAQDLYDSNAIDLTAFINCLNIAGNKDATFINCIGKGYRLDGSRHPHAWSIVDANDCMKWLNTYLK